MGYMEVREMSFVIVIGTGEQAEAVGTFGSFDEANRYGCDVYADSDATWQIVPLVPVDQGLGPVMPCCGQYEADCTAFGTRESCHAVADAWEGR
jgi:hypothetical protein